MTMDVQTKRFQISSRIWIEFRLHDCGIDCEWHPAIPKKFTDEEVRAYRSARAEMLHRLAVRVGAAKLTDPIPGRVRLA
jgi:hypothetical protein